ncbi:hypothetical protein BFP71_09705 [Roseivirga misakiensis]|uniref:ABC transporter permease n=2 Tax=Roseivirga misakiensis TaxID=1563681 RepID=A0A1E5T2D8_9BACT|nr:hypothetical protein BFP71_09705 [Roseivirga misakiensis]
MIKNNITVAKRQLLRSKMYSTIKIGGFAIGIAVCLLITLFIKEELDYNKHIPGYENIFMAVKEYHEEGEVEKYTWMAPPYAKTLLADYPEVEKAGRILFNEGFGAGTANIRKANDPTNYYDKGFAFADQSILEIFNYPMVYGDRNSALSEPNSIVLTRTKAEMIFPGQNPVGEIVYIDENSENPMTVGGVIEDLPENSTVKFDYLRSLAEVEFWQGEQTSWGSNNYQVFVTLKTETNPAEFQGKLDQLKSKYLLPTYQQLGFANSEGLVETIHFLMVSLADIHLNSADVVDPFQKSDIKVVMVFAIIAAFILCLACINFINLSTAKSANRAKEVGLRKTIGSSRGGLITQFLTESTLYSLLSFILALVLSYLLLPYFNELAQKSISLPWNELWFIPSLTVASVLIGVVAGLYPAFYLSGFKPSTVLKGELSIGSKSGRLRNTLVILQFTASVVLVIGTFVVYEQISYIMNRDIGFDKEQVLIIESPYLVGDDKIETFRAELNKLPQVNSTSFSGYLPVSGSTRNGNVWWLEGRTKSDTPADGQNWTVDHHYMETYAIELIEGRNFSKEIKSDSAAMVINESMAKALNIADDPIGKKITNTNDNSQTYKVIGVVKDFHFSPMTEAIEPLAMKLGTMYSTGSVKLATDQIQGAIDRIRGVWEEMAPNQPFVYAFLDQRFERMYAEVIRIEKILMAFSLLAILIACLGLFGLSVFLVEQRTREVSVRLVLGAKVGQIIRLLSFNFMKPILISILIAIPIAWYVMKDWINNFVYSDGLNVTVFVVASGATFLIALITISFQSLKAALSSPIKGLRNE